MTNPVSLQSAQAATPPTSPEQPRQGSFSIRDAAPSPAPSAPLPDRPNGSGAFAEAAQNVDVPPSLGGGGGKLTMEQLNAALDSMGNRAPGDPGDPGGSGGSRAPGDPAGYPAPGGSGGGGDGPGGPGRPELPADARLAQGLAAMQQMIDQSNINSAESAQLQMHQAQLNHELKMNESILQQSRFVDNQLEKIFVDANADSMEQGKNVHSTLGQKAGA